MLITPGNFKTEQLKNSRVQTAYKNKKASIETLLKSKNLQLSSLEIHLRAYKSEQIMEVWAKNKTDQTFVKLIDYEICRLSGEIGPKRKEGDLQVPEGFYYINHFNPESSFHLSLGINYPNKSDKILGDKQHPGGSIYIHGKCVTIGCLPITDDKIEELYILCLEAKNNGQQKITVTIFPSRMSPEKYNNLKSLSTIEQHTLNLWEDLDTEYRYFESKKRLPVISFLSNGRHKIQ